MISFLAWSFALPIPLLQTAFELVLLAVDDVEIIVRQLAPLINSGRDSRKSTLA
jgi:hypothetical protein